MLLAFGRERLVSVQEWSKFLANESAAQQEVLERLCDARIRELQDVRQYALERLNNSSRNALSSINTAEQEQANGDYAYCIYKAKEEKARIQYILTTISTQSNDDVFDTKQQAARQQIIRKQENGDFPIVSYTFLRYAEALHEDNSTRVALLFAEQALEFSLMENKVQNTKQQTKQQIELIISSIFLGLLLGLLLWQIKKRKNKENNTEKSKKRMRKKNPKRTQKRSSG